MEQCRRALDDYRPEDCIGFPYAVQRYEGADQVEGRVGLQAFRLWLQRFDVCPHVVRPRVSLP